MKATGRAGIAESETGEAGGGGVQCGKCTVVCEGQPEPMSGILQLLMFWLLLNKISWDTGSQVLIAQTAPKTQSVAYLHVYGELIGPTLRRPMRFLLLLRGTYPPQKILGPNHGRGGASCQSRREAHTGRVALPALELVLLVLPLVTSSWMTIDLTTSTPPASAGLGSLE